MEGSREKIKEDCLLCVLFFLGVLTSQSRLSQMGNLVLYSTNVFLKFHIQQRWRRNIHFVWCSEEFDSSRLSAYALGAGVPPTSNPVDIYRELKAAVDKGDTHNSKIVEQKASLSTLAIGWERSGEISSNNRDDILFLVNHHHDFARWRPLVYVIPRTLSIERRKQSVPAAKCAGLGPEYILSDLQPSEFEIIEL